VLDSFALPRVGSTPTRFRHLFPDNERIGHGGAITRFAAPQIVGAIELFQCNGPQRAAQRRLKRLKKLASVDALTQIPNRRYIETALVIAARKSSATGSSFGVLMIDLDHFKGVNDNYGHAVGDAVLQFVAKTLEHSLRGSDLIGRWGGEEFVAVLPGITVTALKRLAERCRALVETSWVATRRDRVGVTVSIGGAMFEQRSDTVPSLIRRADRLLYRSKAKGRNRVTVV
jgi:diguanylate cyclase (GGDEF)-like protein